MPGPCNTADIAEVQVGKGQLSGISTLVYCKDKAKLRQTAGGMRQLLLLSPGIGQQHTN